MWRVSALPASVRLSLWATAAYAGHCDLGEAIERALPDIDHVDGAQNTLQTWMDLGEQVVCAALPRPGRIATMPRSNPDLLAAATGAGECVFVPALGGALVPTVEEFGPEGDTGWQVLWQGFDADPVPTHQLAALQESEIERGLRETLLDALQELDTADIAPWAEPGARERADQRSAVEVWGLPPGLPGRAVRVIQLSGTIAAACEAGLEDAPATDGVDHNRRERLLRDLLLEAETALAGATTAAAMSLGGLRHVRD